MVTARDGLEAIEKAFAEDVGLVILDVMMPRMNGYQACRLLKTEAPTKDLPVVILTSKDQAGDRFWGLETGADYYITKDAEPQRILDLVKKILATPRGRRGRASGARGRTSVDILSRVNELLDRKLFEATILSEIGRVAAEHRALRRELHVGDGRRRAGGRLHRRRHGLRRGGGPRRVPAAPAPGRPAVIEEAKARLLEAIARERAGLPSPRCRRGSSRPAAPRRGRGDGPRRLRGLPRRDQRRARGPPGRRRKGPAARSAARPRPSSARPPTRPTSSWRTAGSSSGSATSRSATASPSSSTTGTPWSSWRTSSGASGRYEGGVSLLMIDIDHFKKVNDEHGHQAGDSVLRDVARILQDTLRTVDSVGRYGGEEFAAILPHTDHEEALQTGERIRQAVDEHPSASGPRELHITVSVGVATYPSEARRLAGRPRPRGRQGALPREAGGPQPGRLAHPAAR